MRIQAEVSPDFGAVAAADELHAVIGALMTAVLILAVLMLIVSAVSWAIASATGNYQGLSRARMGVLISVLTAIAAGAGIAWANFLISTGEQF